ncbi:MAG TPA: hypothetical protein VHB30_02465 [Solirubrobacteraceae bacterium]|nr:hypothetical protein [Solirubrobacteraceae bacterium]
MPLRRAIALIAASAVVLGVAIAIVVVLVSGDSPTPTSAGTVLAGGSDRAATGGYLRAGNVELRYASAADRAPLERLAREVAGPPSDALARAGQEVRVVHDGSAGGIVARAWRHSLTVTAPSDPRLQEFVDAWLGRGAAG